MSDIDEMKTDMIGKLTAMLIEKNPSIGIEKAMDEVFKSDTYRKIMSEKSYLYYQSPGYVYSILEEELQLGKTVL